MKVKVYKSGVVEITFDDSEVSLFKEMNCRLVLEMSKTTARVLKEELPA